VCIAAVVWLNAGASLLKPADFLLTGHHFDRWPTAEQRSDQVSLWPKRVLGFGLRLEGRMEVAHRPVQLQ
jgi:hypothetical protein